MSLFNVECGVGSVTAAYFGGGKEDRKKENYTVLLYCTTFIPYTV